MLATFATYHVNHIKCILVCDHPGVKTKRESVLTRYKEVVKLFSVKTNKNKLREILNIDPSCTTDCKDYGH